MYYSLKQKSETLKITNQKPCILCGNDGSLYYQSDKALICYECSTCAYAKTVEEAKEKWSNNDVHIREQFVIDYPPNYSFSNIMLKCYKNIIFGGTIDITIPFIQSIIDELDFIKKNQYKNIIEYYPVSLETWFSRNFMYNDCSYGNFEKVIITDELTFTFNIHHCDDWEPKDYIGTLEEFEHWERIWNSRPLIPIKQKALDKLLS